MADDVAVYGVGIDSGSAEQGRDRTVKAFRDIEKAAGGTQAAVERVQRAQETAGRAAAEAANQYTRAQQELIAQSQRQLALASALDVQSRQSVATFNKENAALRALAEQSGNLHLVQTQLALAEGIIADESVRAARYINALNAEVRASVAANAEAAAATTANVVAHEAAGVAAMGHGLQLGRLRMELGTLVGRLTGTNTALDRMGGAIASMGLGDPVVIGVLAGLAAIAYGYSKITEESRKAAKEVEDARKRMDEAALKRDQGPAGQSGADANFGMVQSDALLAKIRDEQRQLADLQNGASYGRGTQERIKALKQEIEETSRAYAVMLDHTHAVQDEADRKRETAAAHEHDQLVASLAERLQFNQRDAAARKEALRVLAADQAEYAKLILQPFSPETSAQLARDATEIKRIQDALNPKTKVAADDRKYDSEQRALTQLAALDEHRLAAAKALDEAASHGRAEYERVLHTQQIEKQVLDEQYEILKLHLDANGKIRKGEEGAVAAEQQAAADRLHQIDQLEQHTRDTIDAEKKAHESRVAWAHEEARAAKEFADEQQRVAKAIESDMLHAIERFSTRGLNDFQSFFAEVERLSLSMVGHIDDALQKDAAMFADAMDRNDMAAAQAISDEMKRLEQLRKFAAPIAAGIAAASTGYQIGHATGSTAIGGIGGAASGAMAGAEFGPWGVAAGAVIGLTAGIIGAGHAAAEAAKHMAELQTAVTLSMNSLRAEVDHNTLGGGIAQINADREARRKAIEDAYAGGDANSEQVRKRVAALNEMNHLEDVRVKQLIEETAAAAALAEQQKKRDQEDLSVRILAAQGYTDASSDAAFRNQQQREYQDAVTAKRSPEYLALLTAAQMDEAIQRATQRDIEQQTAAIQSANKTQQESLDAQLKTAQDTLKINQDQLRTAEENARALQRVVDSLAKFGDSLKLSDLSPLSPVDQLTEAKRQLDADYAKAQGGDLQAGGDFANYAKAFLTASREVNASGTAYASDFATVQQMTDALQGKFGPQLSEQQQIVAQLTAANAALQAQIDATQAAKEAAQAAADAQIAKLQATLTQDAALSDAQVAVLQQNREAAKAANNAAIEAVNAGRDAATVANLQQIAVLEQSRLEMNAAAYRQEDALAAQRAVLERQIAERQAAETYQQQQDDVQLQQWIAQDAALGRQKDAIEAVRAAANDKANEQIAVLAAIRDKNWTPTIVFTPPATDTYTGNPSGGGTDTGVGPDGKPIPMFASGGYFGGGMRLVGERGPELEFTGPSRIASASQTSSLLADALGQSAEMAAELRDLNDSSAATVAVLQAGLLALVQRVEELTARVEENTKATKRGFEGMS